MNVFIAGGTTGIGFALGLYYLKKGDTVGVCGRDISKVPKNYKDKYKNLYLFEVDVFDKEKLRKSILEFSKGKLDLLIASAGSYSNSRTVQLTSDEAENMLKVNIMGMTNSIDIAREIMVPQREGKIAVISSIAGLMQYPGASVYSSSKGALIKIAEAYRTALEPFGITVCTIAPGYINTAKLREINNGDISKKPFLYSVDKAVRIITKSIRRGRPMTVFPFRMKVIIGVLKCLPKGLLSFILLRKKDT